MDQKLPYDYVKSLSTFQLSSDYHHSLAEEEKKKKEHSTKAKKNYFQTSFLQEKDNEGSGSEDLFSLKKQGNRLLHSQKKDKPKSHLHTKVVASKNVIVFSSKENAKKPLFAIETPQKGKTKKKTYIGTDPNKDSFDEERVLKEVKKSREKEKEKKKETEGEKRVTVQYDVGPGILPSIFGPLLWFFIHVMTFLNAGTFVEQKDFVRLICISLPCLTCHLSMKNFTKKGKHPFSVEEASNMQKQTANANSYMQLWWVDMHNYVNKEIGRKQVDYSVLKKINVNEKTAFKAIRAFIRFLQYCAVYQLSPYTRVSTFERVEKEPVSQKTKQLSMFRQLLPLVQLTTFITTSNFFAHSPSKVIQSFVRLCIDYDVTNQKFYFPITSPKACIRNFVAIDRKLVKMYKEKTKNNKKVKILSVEERGTGTTNKKAKGFLPVFPMETIEFLSQTAKEATTYIV